MLAFGARPLATARENENDATGYDCEPLQNFTSVQARAACDNSQDFLK